MCCTICPTAIYAGPLAARVAYSSAVRYSRAACHHGPRHFSYITWSVEGVCCCIYTSLRINSLIVAPHSVSIPHTIGSLLTSCDPSSTSSHTVALLNGIMLAQPWSALAQLAACGSVCRCADQAHALPQQQSPQSRRYRFWACSTAVPGELPGQADRRHGSSALGAWTDQKAGPSD